MSAIAMTQERTIKLAELARAVPGCRVIKAGNAKVSGIAYDSRKVSAGDLFVAIRGFESDGHAYASNALKAGGVALALEREISEIPDETPRLLVPDGRTALALISDTFYGHPSGELVLVGVTGTNGKTTTTYLIDAIFRRAGLKSGLVGTIHCRVGDRVFEGPRTTPEAPDLQASLQEMLEAGASHAVVEVSSHALSLKRVLGCNFRAAVFTNLTQEHLDFHDDLNSYFLSKRSLFTENPHVASILNLDDEYGRRIASDAAGEIWGYGSGEDTIVRAENILISAQEVQFTLHHPQGRIEIRATLLGQHNVSNILASAATCLALGLSAEEVAAGVLSLESVPGRFEWINEGQPFLVVVDYAHTEDALARVLALARPITQGRLITVMGCGGDRDKKKRPRMGAAAVRASDLVFLTSDNPRTEDPMEILRDVEEGTNRVSGGKERSRTIVDRREAIRIAVEEAKEGDTVLIAGKGHETYQIVGIDRIPFDDRDEAREAIRNLGFGR